VFGIAGAYSECLFTRFHGIEPPVVHSLDDLLDSESRRRTTMNGIKAQCRRGGYAPRVEALEDRCVLDVSITGMGQIVTTASVNQVLITDDGTNIRVFSDNSPNAPLATFTEGTPLGVSTNKPGSKNLISYEVLGTPLATFIPPSPGHPPSIILSPGTHITGNLAVNFGSGTGNLLTQVTTSLPNNLADGFAAATLIANLGDLGNSSTLNITTSGSGATNVAFASRDIGKSAKLQFDDHGGKGTNVLFVLLTGAQHTGSQVAVNFWGNSGTNQVFVSDEQNIASGATAFFNLDGHPGKAKIQLNYTGQLQGNLNVVIAGGGRPKLLPEPDPKRVPSNPATLILNFELLGGSSGALSSTELGGPGNDTLTDLVRKTAADTPSFYYEAVDGGGGTNTGTVTHSFPNTQTSQTEMSVTVYNVQKVIPV
jgi:hypothetical protein